MLDAVDYIIIFILGAGGGFLSGFLGVGGGIIYVPILSYYLGKMGMNSDLLVKGILANSLFTIIFSGSFSSYKQYKSGNFYPKQIIQTAIPGIVSVLVTTWLIRNGDWYSVRVFNYVFAFMLLTIALRMFFAGRHHHHGDEASQLQYGLTGLLTGVVTAMSGLGGGVVMTPVFTDLFHQSIKKASSISNGVIPLFAIVVGMYNLTGQPEQYVHEWQVGYIVFPVVIPMVLSAMLFAPLGVKTSHSVSHTFIRIFFAVFVSLVFIKTLFVIIG